MPESRSLVRHTRDVPACLVVLVIIATSVTLVGGFLFYQAERRQETASAHEQLSIIAEQKVQRIEEWRSHHIRALRTFAIEPSVKAATARVMSGDATAEDRALLLHRLRTLADEYGLDNAWIADRTGRPVVALDAVHAHYNPALRDALRFTYQRGYVTLSEIHLPAVGAQPHVHVVAPVSPVGGQPVAAIVGDIPAHEYLFPLISSWPVPSETAETLLVRRDGDDVLFLNDVRFRSGSALSLRIPLSRTDVPAVKAVLGERGLVRGVDYRGERVLAYISPVPNTTWYMVSKVDEREALRVWRSEQTLILAVLGLVLCAIAGSAVTGWQRSTAAQRKRAILDLEATLALLRSRTESARELLVDAIETGMHLTGSTAAALYRHDDAAGEFIVDVRMTADGGIHVPPRPHRFPIDRTAAWAEVLRTRRPLVLDDTAVRAVHMSRRGSGAPPLTSAMLLPLIIDEQVVAVAGFANKPGGYDDADIARAHVLLESVWHEYERRVANEELAALNAELEQRVAERTEELAEANEELQAQAEELAAQAEELEAQNEELLAQAEELKHQSEQLAEANEAKTRFLRSMSHELRTPLNSIIGFSNIMLQGLAGSITDEQRTQLTMINDSGKHLLALINDLLDLSRIDAGAISLSFETIDVAALARETVEAIRPEADAKGLALHIELPSPTPTLASDRTRVKQILLNLLSNAVKFTESGSITMRVRTPSIGMVAIEVEDSGPGIPAWELERIFGEFVQLPQHERASGTGLGLAISRRLAGALGGTLTATSEVGRGSTFKLVLPLGPAS